MSAVQLAQLDATGRTVTLIVFGLLAVATALALLTAWYWRVTDPRRSDRGSKPTPPGRPPGRQPPATDGPDGDRGAPPDTPATSPEAAAVADQTRVFDRQAIVSHTEPSTEPPGDGDPSPSADTVPEPPESRTPPPATPPPDQQRSSPPLHDETIIDLRDAPRPEPSTRDRRTAENESGLTFEEWLALAEEDR